MIALPDAAPGGTYEGCGGALGRLNGFLRISQRFLFFFFFFSSNLVLCMHEMFRFRREAFCLDGEGVGPLALQST